MEWGTMWLRIAPRLCFFSFSKHTILLLDSDASPHPCDVTPPMPASACPLLAGSSHKGKGAGSSRQHSHPSQPIMDSALMDPRRPGGHPNGKGSSSSGAKPERSQHSQGSLMGSQWSRAAPLAPPVKISPTPHPPSRGQDDLSARIHEAQPSRGPEMQPARGPEVYTSRRTEEQQQQSGGAKGATQPTVLAKGTVLAADQKGLDRLGKPVLGQPVRRSSLEQHQ